MKKIVAFSYLITFLAIFIFVTSREKPSEAGLFGKQKRTAEKGIYLTAYTVQRGSYFSYLKEQCKKAGLNTLVIDGKASLCRPFIGLAKQRKLTKETKPQADPWLTKLAEELHKEGFILSVRVVAFKDDQLAALRPDLAIHLSGGGIYRDKKGGLWVDPYNDEVRLYNALIAESAALSGVDEVQFDYIRFPAEGAARFAVYPLAKPGITKVDIICQFLKEVRERTNRYNVSLALDIFGVTAWQSRYDIEILGQDLKKMAPYLDVISPMLYPSHFHAGYDGFANPGSEPYYFINAGVAKAQEILSDEATVLVPWIQGFNLLSPNYGPQYIRDQVRAAKDAGVDRFLIWNARNVYDVSFTALKH